MKSLEQLTNVDKAKLLHELFPAEMPQLVDYYLGVSEYVREHVEELRKKWDNPLMSLEAWVRLAEYVEQTIKKHGEKLHKSSSLFSDQLFGGYSALFTCHWTYQYTITQQKANHKFSLAVDMLFNI